MSHPEAAVAFGCAGPTLGDEERRFFRDAAPWGFILFARNCIDPAQVRRLVGELRDCVERADAPVLIDQEGGRVQRLKPPHWRQAPPAGLFGALAARDPAAGRDAVRVNARLLAADLEPLGITVDCAPCLDVPAAGAHDVIGDRAFAADAATVATLGQAFADGLAEGGVLPVMKHLPGHGRAGVDSHLELPVVHAPRKALDAVDFAPFRALAKLPMAMTAHVVYADIDPGRPATLSPTVIADSIRRRIGFDGLLFSDDIGMEALQGPVPERAAAALAAGCDVVLHCNGRLDEMKAVAASVGPLSERAAERAALALAARDPASPIDRAALQARLDALLADASAAPPQR